MIIIIILKSQVIITPNLTRGGVMTGKLRIFSTCLWNALSQNTPHICDNVESARFGVLKAVVTKFHTFWDVSPFRLVGSPTFRWYVLLPFSVSWPMFPPKHG